jgi:hypothetical protein
MAEPRTSPYIHVSWLAKIMSGDNPCHWQGWFLAHNKLTEKQPSDFDLAGWLVDHTRLLSELEAELSQREGALVTKEYELRQPFADFGTMLSGKADCVCISDSYITIYDCKTGKERNTDQVQVMIYMWMMSRLPVSDRRTVKGEVVYRSRRQPIGEIPPTFEDNLKYFVRLLGGEEAPMKTAGETCRFCDITKIDCPDRAD